MRRTAVALAALLALASCSEETDEPELPPEGPLSVLKSSGCVLAPGGGMILATHRIRNDADIALTIDEVDLVDPVNVELVEAMDEHGEPMVDATLGATDEPGNARTLRLQLRLPETGQAATWSAVEVVYHNVEGEFRDVGAGGELTRARCPE